MITRRFIKDAIHCFAKAYERSKISENPEYQKFVNENSWWLSDYALFVAVKGRFDNVEWTKWAEDIRLRWK